MSTTASDLRLRRDLASDVRRTAANRQLAPRAVALGALLCVAIDHEREIPWSERMPMPAFERLEIMAATVSAAAGHGSEITLGAQAEALAFLHEHVKDHSTLMRKVAERVGR